MTLDQYQVEAAKTDKQTATQNKDGLIVPLLGLAGEAGSLLTLYKKWLRDGDAYQIVNSRIGEELGDILWYVATIARKSGLTLSEVANTNLEKVRARWLDECPDPPFLDQHFPVAERIPRTFVAQIRDFQEGAKRKTELLIDGKKAGDYLTDNAYADDGYRFHDIFHLSYAVILGWSPVLRANLGRKRKSDPTTDEVEDGGRAIAIEEGICALVFGYAQNHRYLDGVSAVDFSILRTCQEMAQHLEVSQRSLNDWEQAILCGYQVWRRIRDNGGGSVSCDLSSRQLKYLGVAA
jgi:NTP pyrophosphatase (non-canonical NTP hydrolase)